MKKIFITLLLVALMFSAASASSLRPSVPANPVTSADIEKEYIPRVTLKNTRENKSWKNYERYEISKIDEFQGVYNPGDQVVFFVEGRSSRLDVDEANGFKVFATMIEILGNVVSRVEIQYDNERHAWQANLTAPKDKNKEYKIVINLFCKTKDSPCATSYGDGTQVDKILSLQVQ